MIPGESAEWLETDGLGGFASGTAAGPRTRRYHALLMAALTPPTGRVVLVDGFDAWLEDRDGQRLFLTRQRYCRDMLTGSTLGDPEFNPDPWPVWTWRLPSGETLRCELFVPRGAPAVALHWASSAPPDVRLVVRPFLSGRDIHSLHHENRESRPEAEETEARIRWQPYRSLPAVLSVSNGVYRHDPVWYRNFELIEERARGFDHTTDCFSPGELHWDLAQADAVWMLSAEGQEGSDRILNDTPVGAFLTLRKAELHRRARFTTPLHRAADAYLVRRGNGMTIIAGYPWFTDWGRDTFIALRGLCLATGRWDDARDILLAWAGTVSQGMLPNRFVDQGDVPEFNAVDASLWFVISAWEYLQSQPDSPARLPIEQAIDAIVSGYAAGTRFGIHVDRDGLLSAGETGVQLTWMDAKVGDWVVTPRVGKPVEVQALWINALQIASHHDPTWAALQSKALAAFRARFWNPERGCLYDVIDCGFAGRVDGSVRPNQIFAVGGLPFPLLDGEPARRVLEVVRSELLTPMGLRSLSRDDPEYAGRYAGGPQERDGAYHQGTVWPWLVGALAEAWLRVEGNTPAVRARIRETMVAPLMSHLAEAGLGHISEIADADAPHSPRGCPFQAWSLGELIRVVSMLDRNDFPAAVPRPPRRASRINTRTAP